MQPEHVHLLVNEPERAPLSVAIQMLKQVVSQKLRRAGQRRFWQVRYYDFPVWSEAKSREKMKYIHRNPVKRGFVARPEEWKWSSFSHYATGAEGVVEIESQWTATRRERAGQPLRLRRRGTAPSSAKPGRKDGATVKTSRCRKGGPAHGRTSKLTASAAWDIKRDCVGPIIHMEQPDQEVVNENDHGTRR